MGLNIDNTDRVICPCTGEKEYVGDCKECCAFNGIEDDAQLFCEEEYRNK